jgi:carboxyl-terminal processing protease
VNKRGIVYLMRRSSTPAFLGWSRAHFPTLLGVLFLVGVLLVKGGVLSAAATDESERDSGYANISLFTRVMETIRQHYVDGEKVSYQELTQGALKGMLASLDPHSQYLDQEAYLAMKSEAEGQFGGIGITVGVKDGLVTIVAPMDGTPGAKAGLMAGDRIIRVDGKSTERMPLGDVIKKLRGDVGTKITLTVLRSGTNEVKDIPIERAIIKMDSVRDVKILPAHLTGSEKIGYLRISQFSDPTADDFEKALVRLEGEGMRALILDLRNNPGGLLDAAAEVAGKFIPPGELIVSTEGRVVQNKTVIRSDARTKHCGYPIAVLINAGSASGAEIVAGALQDTKRAILVGETTFGKGSVQSVLPLPDQSAIRLTTAKYYTPAHKLIHEKGVVPDIYVTITPEEGRRLQRLRAGPLTPREKMDLDGLTDPQMDRAIETIKGIRIYADRAGSATAMKTAER